MPDNGSSWYKEKTNGTNCRINKLIATAVRYMPILFCSDNNAVFDVEAFKILC